MENNTLLKTLKEKATTYSAMVEFCAANMILNNAIISELAKKDLYFDIYAGSERSFYNVDGEQITEDEFYELEENGAYDEYNDIFQYFLISSDAAERFAEFTNELIYYCEEIDLYILGVKHYGTSWNLTPANWKDCE